MTHWFAQTRLAFKQTLRSLNRARLRRRHAARRADYAEWIAAHDTIDAPLRLALAQRAADLDGPAGSAPLITVVMPTYNPNAAWLRAAVASVRSQIYPHWQLSIADDASTHTDVAALLLQLKGDDARIDILERPRNGHICVATNDALAAARGSWVVFMDHDDGLAEHALLLIAEAAQRHADAQLIYSDEDMLGPDGRRESPYFKPDWNAELCRSQNYVCHVLAVKRALLERVGGLRVGYEGAQDHDLVLRCSEVIDPTQIVHIPHVLYHWRRHDGSTAGAPESKPYASDAGRRAVQSHCDRMHEPALVSVMAPGRYRVAYTVPEPAPSVCIIVPTRDQAHLLTQCLDSVLAKTRYPNFDVLVIDNGSTEPQALAYLHALAEGSVAYTPGRWRAQADDPPGPRRRAPVRVIVDPQQPFNYSALNNRAVAQTHAEYLVLMNNDIEVLDGDWLGEMVGHAARAHVGAVGAKLLYPDRTVQHAGVIVGNGRGAQPIASPAFKGLGAHAGGHGGRAHVAQSYRAVTAACLVIARTKYLQVGGLDETHLAVAYNDVDLCLKLVEAGYTNVWTPHALLLHHESVSRGRDASAAQQARFQNEAHWMWQRWSSVLPLDPAYNPNLNQATSDFALADAPRVSYRVLPRAATQP